MNTQMVELEKLKDPVPENIKKNQVNTESSLVVHRGWYAAPNAPGDQTIWGIKPRTSTWKSFIAALWDDSWTF